MQPARPTLPSSNPALRPGSQPPGPTVYTGNQPIMMTMTPMPFPSPQAPQYYISQVSAGQGGAGPAGPLGELGYSENISFNAAALYSPFHSIDPPPPM